MLKVIKLDKLSNFGFTKTKYGYWYKTIETKKYELDVCVIADKKGCLYINAMVDKASKEAHYIFDKEIDNEEDIGSQLDTGCIIDEQCETNIDLDFVYDLIIAGLVVKC